MSMGLCPTRASRAPEPRYYYYNDNIQIDKTDNRNYHGTDNRNGNDKDGESD